MFWCLLVLSVTKAPRTAARGVTQAIVPKGYHRSPVLAYSLEQGCVLSVYLALPDEGARATDGSGSSKRTSLTMEAEEDEELDEGGSAGGGGGGGGQGGGAAKIYKNKGAQYRALYNDATLQCWKTLQQALADAGVRLGYDGHHTQTRCLLTALKQYLGASEETLRTRVATKLETGGSGIEAKRVRQRAVHTCNRQALVLARELLGKDESTTIHATLLAVTERVKAGAPLQPPAAAAEP